MMAVLCMLMALSATGAATGATAGATTGTTASAAAPGNDGTELPSHLTLAEALERFHRVGFDLLLAEASVQSAEADVKSAGAVNNPALSAAYLQAFTYNVQKCPECDKGDGFSVGIADSSALFDIISGKRGLRVDVAKAALRASRLNRDDARRSMDALLKEQYLAVAVDKMALALLETIRASLAKTYQLFNLRYGQGDISEADAVRVEVQSLQSEQDADAAQAALVQDKVVLAFLLGVRGATPNYDIDTGWLEQTQPMAEEAVDVPDLLQYAVVHRADLRAQAAQRERAESSIALGRRLRFPDIELVVSYQQQGTGNNAPQPPTLSVGLTLTPPLFNQYEGDIRRAEADVHAQRLLFDKLSAQVASDIGAAHQALKTSRTRLTRMQQHLRGRAERVLELVRLQYSKGAGTLLDLLDAQRTYTSVNQDYLNNLSDYWTARFEMEQAMGMQVQP